MRDVERGRKVRCVDVWMGDSKSERGKRRDSFIAKGLLKTLRKLPPLHVSDFVRRIPLPLQTLSSQEHRACCCLHIRAYDAALSCALTKVQ